MDQNNARISMGRLNSGRYWLAVEGSDGRRILEVTMDGEAFAKAITGLETPCHIRRFPAPQKS